MPELQFQIRDPNHSTPHQITLRKSGKNLTVICSCEVGNQDICQHRINILSGSAKNIVSTNTDDLKKIKSWVSGTDVSKALQNLLECVKLMENATDDFNNAKKRLIKALND